MSYVLHWRRWLPLFGLVCLSSHASEGKTATNAQQATGTDKAALMLDALRQSNGVPGMSAAVWQDGRLVWDGASGFRDLAGTQPVDSNTVFRFASVSKVITATAAAKLQEQGKLNWDAPVQSYLPWLNNDWPAITSRQLAAHLSGLPHYQAIDALRGKRHHSTARDAVGNFARRSLLAAPGETYHYSSWGYTLLGAVIEAQSGQHFIDYVKREITTDLNIQADPDGKGNQISQLFTLDGGVNRISEPHDLSYTWGGGGLAGTAESLARFGGRVLDSEIVARQTFEAMIQPTLTVKGVAAGERGFLVGFGWRTSQDGDSRFRTVHHNGATLGARSALVMWPEQRTTAALLSNASWVSHIDKTAALLAAPFLPSPEGLAPSPCPVNSTQYQGQLGDTPISGRVQVRLHQGICTALLDTDTALRKQFTSANAWPDQKLRLVGLDQAGGLSRAALATPFGLYEMRAQSQGILSTDLSATARLRLVFVQSSKGADNTVHPASR